MTELVSKLLPIIVLLLIGYLLKRRKTFSDYVVDDLKKILLTIALPAVLFDAFSTMKLQLSYTFLFFMIFLYCAVLYGIGVFLNWKFATLFPYKNTKGYMTGFEFGMIGVGLFSALWGMDQLWVIMLIGLGHELFIWFFYATLLSKSMDEKVTIKDTLLQFIKTPTILAIVLGIICNVAGVRTIMEGEIWGRGIISVIEFLKPLTSPLILLVIGYTMTFTIKNASKILWFLAVRMILVLGLGGLVLVILHRFLQPIDPLFDIAFWAFILLPAPYILPLYIKENEEASFFSQLLVYSTIVSFVAYTALFIISKV